MFQAKAAFNCQCPHPCLSVSRRGSLFFDTLHHCFCTSTRRGEGDEEQTRRHVRCCEIATAKQPMEGTHLLPRAQIARHFLSHQAWDDRDQIGAKEVEQPRCSGIVPLQAAN